MAMSTMLHEEKFPDQSKSHEKGRGDVNAFGEEIPQGPHLLPLHKTETSWTDRIKMSSIGFGNTKEGVKEDFRELRGGLRQEARELRGEAHELKEDAKDKAEMAKEKLKAPVPVPAFSDMSKAANDLINKDFYHTAQATLDVKLKAPNGTNVTVKGKQGFDGVTTGSFEGKHTIKPHGTRTPTSPPSSSRDTTPSMRPPKKTERSPPSKPFINLVAFYTQLPAPLRTEAYLFAVSMPDKRGGHANQKLSLTVHHNAGVTITGAWNTASLLDTKVELADVVAQDVKLDLQNLINVSKGNSATQKITATFKKSNIHGRLFANYATSSGNIDTVVDAVAGLNSFLVGGEAGYDVQKAAITRYSFGLGYQAPTYNASINLIQNLSVVSAAFYQRVNSEVEVGAKAGYDVNAAKASGLELASKYKLDGSTFAKAKINDRGIMALAYSTKLNLGTTLGLGVSLDTNKLNEAGHKVGTSLTFEG